VPVAPHRALSPYRTVLGVPGVPGVTVLGILARIPHTAIGVVLTVHVTQGLGRGYGAAGLVVAALTVGMAVGSPWRGRAVDRLGLRRALLPSVVVEGLVWALAPLLPYEGLLVAVVAAGALGLPVFTVMRLALSAMVPAQQRRTAFALDSVSVEVSFMVGPALGVLVATQTSSSTALLGLGATTVLAGLALMVVDPPTRAVPQAAPGARGAAAAGADSAGASGGAPGGVAGSSSQTACVVAPAGVGEEVPPRPAGPHARVTLSPPLLAVLAATAGATVVLAGTDVSIVAVLREAGRQGATGLVMAVWAFASLLGGLGYGALRRGVVPPALLLALGLLTAPVGLAPGWLWLCLAVVPAGLVCAPVVTATAEAVASLVPESVRGEAMGWHGSALTAGTALGAPLAGVAIDRVGPWAGFALVGAVGALVALLGLAGLRVRRSRRPVLA
jgi:MFS family permease